MYTLVEIGILNALTAGVLALVVLLIGRVLRRPAVMHALWILVLLKLVTPPIVAIPVGLRLESLASLTNASEAGHDAASPARLVPPPAAAAVSSEVATNQVRPEVANAPQLRTTHTDASVPPAAPAFSSTSISLRRTAAVTIPLLLGLWFAGTLAWFVVQGWRIASFVRLTAKAHLADEAIQQQTRQLAASMGARRAPQIWVLDATMSPILWAVGSRARVIFPADLLDRVDVDARATLLTHELAHFHRGDHWVRLLEFVVTGLFWWHPVTWLARREIEFAEEHCCDAWVVSQFPGQPRRYAEALLDTIDFLSEDRPRVVPVASGLGQAPFLRQRIRLIMSGVAPKAMSGTTRLAVLAAAAVLLPLGPQLFESALRRADAALISVRNVTPIADFPLPAGEPLTEATGAADLQADPVEVPGPVEVAGDSVAPADQNGFAWTVANSPDGRFQAVAKTDGTFALRDTLQRHSFDLSQYRISSIAFAPHRDLLAAGSSDSNVYLFDCASGELVATFTEHRAAVGSVAVSLDSRFVVSGSRDGVVKLWDLDDESEVPSRIPRQGSAISCVRFSPDGRLLAIASGDWRTDLEGSVALWDLRGGTMKQQIQSTSPVGAIAFADNQLLVAEWSGLTTRWDLRTGGSEVTGTVDKDTVSSAAFAADAQALLLAAADGEKPSLTVPVWFQRMDLNQDGQLAWNEFQGPRGTFRKLDIDADEILSRDEIMQL